MKIPTTILHAAHDNFQPYWESAPDQGLAGFASVPSLDAATVRSRQKQLALVDASKRKQF